MEPLLLLTLLEVGEQEAEVLPRRLQAQRLWHLRQGGEAYLSLEPFGNISSLFPAQSMLPQQLTPLLLILQGGGECGA